MELKSRSKSFQFLKRKIYQNHRGLRRTKEERKNRRERVIINDREEGNEVENDNIKVTRT